MPTPKTVKVEFDPGSLPRWLKEFPLEEQEMVRARAEEDLAFRGELYNAQTQEYREFLVRYEARKWWRRKRGNGDVG